VECSIVLGKKKSTPATNGRGGVDGKAPLAETEDIKLKQSGTDKSKREVSH